MFSLLWLFEEFPLTSCLNLFKKFDLAVFMMIL